VAAIAVLADPRSAAAAAVPAATGRAGPLPDPARTSIWVWAALLAGLLTVACGAVAVVRAAAWPASGRRFDSGAPEGSAGGAPSTGAADPVTAWDALSRGEDPTT
jgi:hypothetical protein